MNPFHLAFPVTDIGQARDFYSRLLGCRIGREAERWIDFDFHGHQLSAHLVDTIDQPASNEVDSKSVPARHFGLVLEWEEWEQLAERLQQAGVEFLIEPCVRFRGEAGEQGTFFIKDPSGNALEFKTFRDMEQLFAR